MDNTNTKETNILTMGLVITDLNQVLQKLSVTRDYLYAGKNYGLVDDLENIIKRIIDMAESCHGKKLKLEFLTPEDN